jgi:hypothetical protein
VFRVKNAVLVVALAGITSLAMADAGGGMISAWVFDDGTARDVNGVNDGINHGGSFAAGKVGDALDLAGGGEYVEIPHDASMDSMASGYTVSAWINARTGVDHGGIVFKGEGIGWGPLFTFRMATTSDVNLTWGGCPEGIEGWFATDGVYNLGEWTHVALTADGSEHVAYVNGSVPVATGGGTNPNPVAGPYLMFPDEPVEIGVGRNVGGADNGDHRFFDGLIDEVSIWSRALSAAEIKEKLIDGSVGVEAKGKATTTWGSLKTR